MLCMNLKSEFIWHPQFSRNFGPKIQKARFLGYFSAFHFSLQISQNITETVFVFKVTWINFSEFLALDFSFDNLIFKWAELVLFVQSNKKKT